jgi:hypothetical protein
MAEVSTPHPSIQPREIYESSFLSDSKLLVLSLLYIPSILTFICRDVQSDVPLLAGKLHILSAYFRILDKARTIEMQLWFTTEK